MLVLQGSVHAYTIDDYTLVGRGKITDGGVYPVPHAYNDVDVLGQSNFDIFGINLNYNPSDGNLNVKLYSNFDGEAWARGLVPIALADFFLDLNGDSVYEYGIVLSNYETLTPGDIYTAYLVGTSYDYLEGQTDGKYYEYGEVLKQGTTEEIPVHIKPGGTLVDDAKAILIGDFKAGTKIGSAPATEPTYMRELIIPLGDLNWTSDQVGIFWAGSTCANDIIEGKVPVPEPATMLLLGAGLVGLAAVGRKKLFKG